MDNVTTRKVNLQSVQEKGLTCLLHLSLYFPGVKYACLINIHRSHHDLSLWEASIFWEFEISPTN